MIISSPNNHHVMNGGCAKKRLSPNLKSPDPCKKSPHHKQSHIMESRAIKGAKDISHEGPPGLPKGIIGGALSYQNSNPPCTLNPLHSRGIGIIYPSPGE